MPFEFDFTLLNAKRALDETLRKFSNYSVATASILGFKCRISYRFMDSFM